MKGLSDAQMQRLEELHAKASSEGLDDAEMGQLEQLEQAASGKGSEVIQPDDDHLITTPEPEERYSATDAAVLGAGQGSTLGFADEITGAGNALYTKGRQLLQDADIVEPDPHVSDEIHRAPVKINGKVFEPGVHVEDTPPERQSFGDAYREERDASLKSAEDAKAAHGAAYAAGELGGALLTPVPKVGKIAKGASFLTKAVKYGKAALPISVALGIGTSKGDLTRGELGEVAKDAAITGAGGTVLGGLTGAALDSGGQLVRQWLRKKAGLNAAKAAGVRGGITNAMQKMGMRTKEDVENMGREMLDSGLIPFAGTKDKVFQRANEKLEQVGPGIDSYFEAAGKAGKPDFDDAIGAGTDVLDSLDEVAKDHTGKADKLIDAWERAKDKGASFLDTRRMNTSANKTTNHATEVPLAEDIAKDVKRAMRDKIMEQVETLLGPDEAEGLKALNRVYAISKKAQKLASNAATREASNHSTGLIGSIHGQTLAESLPEVAKPLGFLWPRVEAAATQRLPAALAHLQQAGSKLPQGVASPVLKSLGIGAGVDFENSKKDEDPEEQRLRGAQSAFIMGNGG